MKSSTMVALGVLAGLVLIFYLKETDYRNRVNARENQIEELKKLASGHAKAIHEQNMLKKVLPPDDKNTNTNAGSGVKININKRFKPEQSLSSQIDELDGVTDASGLSTTTTDVDTSTLVIQDEEYKDQGKEYHDEYREEKIVNEMDKSRQGDSLSKTETTTGEPIIENRKKVTEKAEQLNDGITTQTSTLEVATTDEPMVQDKKEQAPDIKVPPVLSMKLDSGLENHPKPLSDNIEQLQLNSELKLTDTRIGRPAERWVDKGLNNLKQLVNENPPAAQLSPELNAKPVDVLNNANLLEVAQNHELNIKMEQVGLVNVYENAPDFKQKRLEPNIKLLGGEVKLANNLLLNQLADSKSIATQQDGLKLVPELKKNDIGMQNAESKASVNKELGQLRGDMKNNFNQLLKDEVQGVNKIVRPLVADGTGVDNVQNNSNFSPERMTTINPKEQVNQQVQLLMRQYSNTVHEKDLPRQNETYTQRLRNKLVMTGKLNLLNAQNESCTKKLPQAIIIGVMKSGTEAFSTLLGVHRQVAMQFGYAAMVFFSSSQYYNGLEWYRERMMCSTTDQVTMEKSPQYWSSAIAPKRIYDMDPNIKLIVLVRDPVARALSHFLQQQSSHPERLAAPTFEDCVYDRKTKTVITNSPYVLQSTYIVILKRCLKYFSFKQILIVDGDTFKINPTRSLTKTESFLGIDHSISNDRLYFNEEKGFYFLKIASKDPKDLEMSCFGSEKGRKHPEIDPEVKAALENYFRPYNEEFMTLTGMNFKW